MGFYLDARYKQLVSSNEKFFCKRSDCSKRVEEEDDHSD